MSFLPCAACGQHSRSPVACPATLRPYDISPGNDNHAFVPVLSTLADALLVEGEEQVGVFIDRRFDFRSYAELEPPRSRGEYVLELLTLGVLRRELGSLVNATSSETCARLRALWRLRSREPQRKAEADRQRGQLFHDILARARTTSAACEHSRLLAWLAATGDFVQESGRLRPWIEGADILWSDEALAQATEGLARWFEREAKLVLGPFTQGVDAFRHHVVAADEPREDLLLVTRSERLYHLNMVGAEIMNRGFRAGFATRRQKVVLLPGCMRAPGDGGCQAQRDGLDITCTHCSTTCEVAAIARLGRQHGFRVFVVPHASSFSAWLEHWSRDPDTALVVAACPLHLLGGGYEIRALGIHAQCILLDFSGCRRHWDPTGTPTRIDRERLLELVPRGDASWSMREC